MHDALSLFASRFTPPRAASEEAGSVCIPALTGSSDAFLALSLAMSSRTVVLVVAPGLPDADRLVDDLRILVEKPSDAAVRLLEFPLPLADDKSTIGLRLKTVAALKAWSICPAPYVVVTTAAAAAGRMGGRMVEPIRLVAGGGGESGKVGVASLEELGRRLAAFGYERLPQVEKEGDYSIRGGIVDAWSPGDEFPVRAEFFGDDLESLRTFSPSTQTSLARLDACALLPASESAEPEGDAAPQTVLDLLPPGAVVLALDHNAYALPASGVRTVFVGDPAPANVPTYAFQTSPLPGFAELGADEAHHPELFDAARRRLEQHLAAAAARGDRVERLDDLSGGFEIPGLVVVTKADRVFAKRKTHVRRTAAALQGPRLSDFDDLEPGEYVVHVDYGVGRYIGSSEIVVDGRRSEVFTIEYDGGAKLHVPAAHAHLLSRYVGVRGEAVHLHRLDGRRWEKDKRAAEKAVTDLAAALLETQARRETVPGFAYDVACDGLDAFEAAFPYEETPDQLASICSHRLGT